MKIRPQNSRKKRVFAGLLAVWMSGVVFLFCCGMPKAQAAEIESCPLAKASHCRKSASDTSPKDEEALRVETFQSGGLAFNCCGFLPQVFDKAKKAEQSLQIADAPKRAIIEPPALVFIKIEPDTFTVYRPRPLNRSGTYLRNRVFRI